MSNRFLFKKNLLFLFSTVISSFFEQYWIIEFTRFVYEIVRKKRVHWFILWYRIGDAIWNILGKSVKAMATTFLKMRQTGCVLDVITNRRTRSSPPLTRCCLSSLNCQLAGLFRILMPMNDSYIHKSLNQLSYLGALLLHLAPLLVCLCQHFRLHIGHTFTLLFQCFHQRVFDAVFKQLAYLIKMQK